MVELQGQEVVPAGDNNVNLVGPCNEHVMLSIVGLTKDDVGQGVAVLILRHGIGVSGLGGLDDFLTGLIAILVGKNDVEDVVLTYGTS